MGKINSTQDQLSNQSRSHNPGDNDAGCCTSDPKATSVTLAASMTRPGIISSNPMTFRG